jgi:hypothetical protein
MPADGLGKIRTAVRISVIVPGRRFERRHVSADADIVNNGGSPANA